jgi:hypothetical protein
METVRFAAPAHANVTTPLTRLRPREMRFWSDSGSIARGFPSPYSNCMILSYQT